MIKIATFVGALLIATSSHALTITPFNEYWNIAESEYGTCAVHTSYDGGEIAFEMLNGEISMYHYVDNEFPMSNIAIRTFIQFEPIGATVEYQMYHPAENTGVGFAVLDKNFLELAFTSDFMVYENSQLDYTVEMDLTGFTEAMAIAYTCNN